MTSGVAAGLVPDWEEVERRTKLLPETDEIPLETPWHRAAMNFLIEILSYFWRARDDFYVGGNMFIYFRLTDSNREEVRGPDFFYVEGTERARARDSWVVWKEGGKYPDLIIELLSPTTAQTDRTTKKALYERTFRTAEYFLYDPATRQLEGWRLAGKVYQAIQPDPRGWMWSDVLQLWLGTWNGEYQTMQATWLRFYDPQGNVVLHETEAARAELAEAEAKAAAAEAKSKHAAAQLAERDAEIARLRALVADKGTQAP
jgi:Uma2 family endonuclease